MLAATSGAGCISHAPTCKPGHAMPLSLAFAVPAIAVGDPRSQLTKHRESDRSRACRACSMILSSCCHHRPDMVAVLRSQPDQLTACMRVATAVAGLACAAMPAAFMSMAACVCSTAELVAHQVGVQGHDMLSRGELALTTALAACTRPQGHTHTLWSELSTAAAQLLCTIPGTAGPPPGPASLQRQSSTKSHSCHGESCQKCSVAGCTSLLQASMPCPL